MQILYEIALYDIALWELFHCLTHLTMITFRDWSPCLVGTVRIFYSCPFVAEKLCGCVICYSMGWWPLLTFVCVSLFQLLVSSELTSANAVSQWIKCGWNTGILFIGIFTSGSVFLYFCFTQSSCAIWHFQFTLAAVLSALLISCLWSFFTVHDIWLHWWWHKL